MDEPLVGELQVVGVHRQEVQLAGRVHHTQSQPILKPTSISQFSFYQKPFHKNIKTLSAENLFVQGRFPQILRLHTLAGLVIPKPLRNHRLHHRVLLELNHHKVLQLLQVLLVTLQHAQKLYIHTAPIIKTESKLA